MRARSSSGERRPGKARAGRSRALGEDVPLCRLERLECSEAPARKEADRASSSATDPPLQETPGAKKPTRAIGLEAQQQEKFRTRPIERGHGETAPVDGRQVDATELEITRDVLKEVDELQSGADVVARRNELRVMSEPQEAEDEAPDGIGRVPAILTKIVPRPVFGDPLIHPVGLDQPDEMLARELELLDRRLEHFHHRPRRPAGVTGLELALELVERRQTIPLDLVAEDVDETGEAVDRPQVRSQMPWEEQRRDGKVLGARSARDDGDIHPGKITFRAPRVKWPPLLPLPCGVQSGAVGHAKPPASVTEWDQPPSADPDDAGASGLRQDPILGIETVDTARVVRLRGELDLYNSARVREALNDACTGDPERLVIDLSAVEFMDSTALGVLIEVRKNLSDRRAFILAGPGPEARRALEISGLDRHFTLRGSVQEALDSEL